MITHTLGIDVETSGQGLRTNFMTCFGAAIVDVKTKTVVSTFKSWLKQPENTCWETRCLVEFWEKNPELYKNTLEHIKTADSREIVMPLFKKWVLENTKDKKTMICFDTPGFDQAWIDYYLEDTSCLYLLGYYQQPTDISSYMRGFAKAPFNSNSKKSFVSATGKEFPVWSVSHDHDPVNDATCIALNAAWVIENCP